MQPSFSSSPNDQLAQLVAPERGLAELPEITPITCSGTTKQIQPQLSCFNGKITIERSRACDVTDQARLLSFDQGDRLSTKNKTLFYASGSDAIPELSYAAGKSEAHAIDKLADGPVSPVGYYRPKKHTADKLESRKLASDCPGLKQPAWWNIPNQIDWKGASLLFKKIDFQSLPIEKLLNPSEDIEALVFEDRQRGFILYRDGELIKIESAEPQMSAVQARFPQGLTATELKKELVAVTESDYQVTHVTLEVNELRFQQTLRVIESLPCGVYYLKGVNGSRGDQVCEISVSNQRLVSARIPPHKQELFEKDTGQAYAKANAEQVLKYMLSSRGGCMRDVFIESQIATEIVDNLKAEQRVVFSCFQIEPRYLCSYSKIASTENVVANRAQGGGAESIRQSFERILLSRSGETDDIFNQVEDTVLRMKIAVTSFAKLFIEKADKYDHNYATLFAVDVCPVWDPTRKQIEFWLLEVQSGPGTEGLVGNIPADEIIAIDLFNVRVYEPFWQNV